MTLQPDSSSENSITEPHDIPVFSGPTEAQVVGIAAKEDGWFARNLPRMAGSLRMVSHGMVIASGLGVGAHASIFRVITGVLGAGAGSLLLMYGEKPPSSESEKKVGESDAPAAASNVVENSAFIFMLSGIALLISGIVSGRVVEAVAGAWTATAFGVQWFVPEHDSKKAEGSESLPRFDGPTKHTHVGVTGQAKEYLEECFKHPMKLSSGMLQISAIWVLWDGIANGDIARIISGVLLATSNAMLWSVKKNDYDKPDNQMAQGR